MSRRALGVAAAVVATLVPAAASAPAAGTEAGETILLEDGLRSPPRDEEAVLVVNRGGEALRDAADAAGVALERRIPEIGVASVDLSSGETVAGLRQSLADEPGVVAIEPNVRLELRAAPADPAYRTADPNAPGGDAHQWHLRKSGFERAWARSNGARATVAVIDTGADGGHPDLAPQIRLAVDKDDTLLHGDAQRDEVGHGSHVAGLACARSGDQFGVASAGFGCGLLVYKTDLSVASIAESIVEATDEGADVINMSFGGSASSQALKSAVARAVEHDVVLVAAADNDEVDDDGNPTEDQGVPASYLQPVGTGPDIRNGDGLVVTAAQYDGSRAWFGPGRGTGISIAGYGAAGEEFRGIFSSFPAQVTEIETLELCGACRGEFQGDNRFGYLEGTSMATPQVAGTAALIRSAKPKISAERVIYLIKQHASRSSGYSPELGWGILNANAAVRAALKKKRKKKG